MTRILLLSDTHSYIDDKIIKYAKEVDEVWHVGDIGNLEVTDKLRKVSFLRAVYGNIDDAKVRREFPEHNRFNCENIDVWMTHIGGYPPKYNGRVRDELNANPPDLFITGHSHILKVMPDKKLDLLHMNPGAIGKHGFQKVRTMLRFTIDDKKIENLEVIEFKK